MTSGEMRDAGKRGPSVDSRDVIVGFEGRVVVVVVVGAVIV